MRISVPIRGIIHLKHEEVQPCTDCGTEDYLAEDGRCEPCSILHAFQLDLEFDLDWLESQERLAADPWTQHPIWLD